MTENHRQHEADGNGMNAGIIGKGGCSGRGDEEHKTGQSEPKIPCKQASRREACLSGEADRVQRNIMPDKPHGHRKQTNATERRRFAGQFSARHPDDDQRNCEYESQLARARRRQQTAEF